MAPKTSEKKVIQEKIAKVREVVDNVTNNDIIMVLHSFDLDVNKAISAFLEDGAASILGGWTTSSGVSVTAAKKKNKNKKKAATTDEPVAAPAATPSSAPVAAPASTAVKATPAAAPATSSVNKPAAAAKPTANGTAAPTDPLSVAFKTIRLALNEREKELKAKSATNFDTAAILKAIADLGGAGAKPVSNGKPVTAPAKQASSPPPAAGPIKHATSQSSITSSVGADSGVNLSPTHKEEKKNTTVAAPAAKTVVNTGGVQLTSSGLNADQLAALQQTLQLSLAARGLDASLITSSENVPRRPKNNNNNKGGADGKKNGKGGQKEQQPKLSIL
uniref:CUE domain-containing protein n=1 Tax=Caenorhabditis japonica TaxID=281687 RepID=A0A8R1HVH9_CAEJA